MVIGRGEVGAAMECGARVGVERGVPGSGEGGGPDLGEGEADLVVGGVFDEAVAAELEGGGVGEEGVGEGGG